MAVHSTILAWRISWIEEPGKLESIGSQRIKQLNWLSMYAEIKEKIIFKNKNMKQLEIYLSFTET